MTYVTLNQNPLTVLLRSLELRAKLDDEDRAAIFNLPHTFKTLEPNTYTVREGDPPTQCGVLISGYAYRQMLTGDGQRQIIAIHIPGDAVDFQNIFLDVADHSVQMLTRGDVALIPRAAIQALVDSRPQVANAILIKILVESAIFRQWVLNVGRRDARSGMAHVFCEFAIRMETIGLAGPDGCTLPMTQEQLADALGMSPVHVNRVLKGLEAERLIHRNRRHIVIPDWRLLRDVADFNQRYLHFGHQEASRPVLRA